MSKNIIVIGTGYVGLTSAACLASIGHRVFCIDSDPKKIEKLNQGTSIIFEEGMQELLTKVIADKKISFHSKYTDLLDKSDAIYIAVGTPQKDTGEVQLDYLNTAVEELSNELCNLNPYSAAKRVIIKSTVPLGTNKRVSEKLAGRPVTVVSNPEFLREGKAIEDFFKTDRIIIGANNPDDHAFVKELYQPILDKYPHTVVYNCKPEEAEMIKYFSNTYLAARIAFANEVATFSAIYNLDAGKILQGMGLDKRIGAEYFRAGPGFGGSCFPKDVAALSFLLDTHNITLPLVANITPSNENRISFIKKYISDYIKENKISKVTMLGLSFKAGTDDIRDSSAIKILGHLAEFNKGIEIKKCDPKAHVEECLRSAKGAVENAQLIIIATEWKEFSDASLFQEGQVIIDLRGMFDEAAQDSLAERKIKLIKLS